ncbi:MAG: hypothetical protein ACLR7Z_21720 [Bilophila wadsworthia]
MAHAPAFLATSGLSTEEHELASATCASVRGRKTERMPSATAQHRVAEDMPELSLIALKLSRSIMNSECRVLGLECGAMSPNMALRLARSNRHGGIVDDGVFAASAFVVSTTRSR